MMKLFIDTANIEEIKEIHALGVLDGVTTNPTLVAKENADFHGRLREICAIVSGSVSGEVIALDAEGMIREGRELAKIAPNMTVKVPMTADGLKAVSVLHKEGIDTNVTLIFTANQALLAARAGATYVSPFVGRMDDIANGSGLHLIAEIAEMFAIHKISAEIIAASIRLEAQVSEAALCGAHIATIPYGIFKKLTDHPLTTQGIERFLADWQAVQK